MGAHLLHLFVQLPIPGPEFEPQVGHSKLLLRVSFFTLYQILLQLADTKTESFKKNEPGIFVLCIYMYCM